jgi:PAS domain S-box-containing protein
MPEGIQPELQSRLLLAAIVDSSDDAIIGKDLNSIISSWNAGAERIFGYTADEIVGRSVLTLIPPELQGEETEIIGRIRKGARLDHFETRRVTKDGRIVEISLTVSPIRNEAGEIIGASKIARDITERKRVERALVEAQRQLRSYAAELERRVDERTLDLQKTVAELEAFSYSLTHDLRAPLRAIQSFLQIFMEDYGGKLDTGAEEMMKKAIASAQRMDGMVLDLLAFTRLGHETMPLVPIDVEKVVETIQQDRPHLRAPRAEVVIQSPLPRVMGNQASLVQCLSNLLDNAAKFVEPGVKPKIRIYAVDEVEMVRLVVEDNGIGIKAATGDALFRIFHRLHGSEYAGTGIGLAIVRKAAERMGGSAGFESQPGHGSRFWLELTKVNA